MDEVYIHVSHKHITVGGMYNSNTTALLKKQMRKEKNDLPLRRSPFYFHRLSLCQMTRTLGGSGDGMLCPLLSALEMQTWN